MLRLETSEPLAGAVVQLSPGDHRTTSDSLGAFRFPMVPAGAYRVRVRSIGLLEARDSITYGLDGLRLLALLGPPPVGLRECSVRTPRPLTRRTAAGGAYHSAALARFARRQHL